MTTPFLVSYIALWLLVGILIVAVFALYHHFGQMYLNSREGREAHGPDPLQPLAAIDGIDVDGFPTSLPDIGRPTFLLFATTDCPLCTDLFPAINDFAERRSDIAMAVVCGGDREEVAEWARGLSDVVTVVPDPRQRLAARYRIGITPFLVAVDREGVVQMRGIVNSLAGLERGAQATREGDQEPPSNEVRHERLIGVGRGRG